MIQVPSAMKINIMVIWHCFWRRKRVEKKNSSQLPIQVSDRPPLVIMRFNFLSNYKPGIHVKTLHSLTTANFVFNRNSFPSLGTMNLTKPQGVQKVQFECTQYQKQQRQCRIQPIFTLFCYIKPTKPHGVQRIHIENFQPKGWYSVVGTFSFRVRY